MFYSHNPAFYFLTHLVTSQLFAVVENDVNSKHQPCDGREIYALNIKPRAVQFLFCNITGVGGAIPKSFDW